MKKAFLEISQNSQENACARVSFLRKLQACIEYLWWLLLKYGLQFEVHLRATETENDKRLDILFCCLERTAFSHLCNAQVNAEILWR